MAWADAFLKALKDNDVRPVSYENGGPMLLAAKIDDKVAPIQTPRDPTLIRIKFMQGMGTSKDGALDGS